MSARVRRMAQNLIASLAELVRITPYFTIVAENDVTVSNVAPGTQVFAGPGDNAQSFVVVLTNISAAGQIIRIGAAPDFATPTGFVLNPGDSWEGYNVNPDEILGVGNAAGGVISRFILRAS